MVLIGLLVWMTLPLLLVVWALRYVPTEASTARPDAAPASLKPRLALTAIILAVAAASIAYRAVVDHGLQQTAALFIGVPVVLAIVVIFMTSPQSATGVACKAVTVGMLLSVLFLWEGFLCVVMAAPLFYFVAIVVTYAVGRLREDARTRTLHSLLLVVLIAPMSLEGVTEFTTLNRRESVTATAIVHSSSTAIEHALFTTPRFDRVLPGYLRAGFPRPTASRIERRDIGLRWVITLRGGETFLDGTEPQTGDLTMDVEERRPGLVRWRAASDTSHMTHFLTFRESVVEWQPIDARTTRVTWTLRYDRGLDPAWYFGPMERYATRLAAGYLIDAVATP
jgi:hypothetical protein